jgi:antirestriction protein ArdC
MKKYKKEEKSGKEAEERENKIRSMKFYTIFLI